VAEGVWNGNQYAVSFPPDPNATPSSSVSVSSSSTVATATASSTSSSSQGSCTQSTAAANGAAPQCPSCHTTAVGAGVGVPLGLIALIATGLWLWTFGRLRAQQQRVEQEQPRNYGLNVMPSKGVGPPPHRGGPPSELDGGVASHEAMGNPDQRTKPWEYGSQGTATTEGGSGRGIGGFH
jgi:hypothetical protein